MAQSWGKHPPPSDLGKHLVLKTGKEKTKSADSCEQTLRLYTQLRDSTEPLF